MPQFQPICKIFHNQIFLLLKKKYISNFPINSYDNYNQVWL